MDLSTVLETKKKNQTGSIHTKLMSWKNVILHLDEDFCSSIRVFKFAQKSRDEVSLAYSVEICLVGRHCSLEKAILNLLQFKTQL